MPKLEIEAPNDQAALFAEIENAFDGPSRFGVTDGRAIGAYLEQNFVRCLRANGQGQGQGQGQAG